MDFDFLLTRPTAMAVRRGRGFKVSIIRDRAFFSSWSRSGKISGARF